MAAAHRQQSASGSRAPREPSSDMPSIEAAPGLGEPVRDAAAKAPSRVGPGPALPPRSAKVRVLPGYSREKALIDTGLLRVAGVDEAGRGPLAGPVVAAAVIFRAYPAPSGIDDSKRLGLAERERLFDAIVAVAEIGIAAASPAEIDRHNIRGATLIAMRRALAALPYAPCHALIDGRDVPPDLAFPGSALIGGDGLSVSIAAASILAKVTRDRMMRKACVRYPDYGFSRHMGYGTPEHLAAIERVGPSPLHRMSFKPLRKD